MKTGVFRASVASMAMIAMWVLASTATAQTVDASAERAEVEPDLGDIVVTAQKREERLEDVPLPVTVVGGEDLQRRFLSSATDLQLVAPTITFGEGSNPGNSSIKIRGVGTTVFDQNVEPTVSVIVDGVVLSRNSQGFVDLIDLDRVEVLKGPQGTLFGRNASGGVINIVTSRPSSNFEAIAEGIVAENGEYQVRGTISGPLGGGLGARLTGFYRTIDGNIPNTFDSRVFNGVESWGLRGKLEFEPSDDVTIYLIADYRQERALGSQETALLVGQDGLTAFLANNGIAPGPTNQRTSTFRPTFADTDDWGVSLQVDVNAGPLVATSQTAWRRYHLVNSDDVDMFAADPNAPGNGLFTNSALGRFGTLSLAGPLDIFQTGDQVIQQFSQEFRLTSEPGSIEYVAGLYAALVDIENVFTRTSDVCIAPLGRTLAPLRAGGPCVANGSVAGIPDLVPFSRFAASRGLPPNFGRIDSRTSTENYAAFAQGTWNVTDSLGITLGLRVQHDRVIADARQAAATTALALPSAPYFFKGSVSETAVSGRFGLEYDFGDTLLYASYARGYKGPTIDFTAAGGQIDVAPEDSDAFEAGIKTNLLNRRLAVSLAGFWTDYSSFQAEGFDAVTGFFLLGNVGAVRTRGVEFDVSARPVPGLTITAGAAYVDAVIRSFPNAQCLTPASRDPRCNLATNRADLAGTRLSNSPEFKANGSIDYETRLGENVTIGGRLSYSYQSSVNFSLQGDPLTRQDGYGIADASLRIGTSDDRYLLTFFVRNLGNTLYRSSIFQDFTSLSAAQTLHRIPVNAERRFGASLRVNF